MSILTRGGSGILHTSTAINTASQNALKKAVPTRPLLAFRGHESLQCFHQKAPGAATNNVVSLPLQKVEHAMELLTFQAFDLMNSITEIHI